MVDDYNFSVKFNKQKIDLHLAGFGVDNHPLEALVDLEALAALASAILETSVVLVALVDLWK